MTPKEFGSFRYSETVQDALPSFVNENETEKYDYPSPIN